MITDEQILELYGEVGLTNIDDIDIEIGRNWLEQHISAERNRLLDKCLVICDKVYSQQAEYNSIGMNAAANIKSSIEALRHE